MMPIFARHGIPDVIVSDNGPQYSSHEFGEFVKTLNVKHITSSPYHPQGNGEAERGHTRCCTLILMILYNDCLTK